MANNVTLKQLLEEHPEWADLPVVVYRADGTYDWVGHSGDVYTDTTEDTEVLVFSGN